MTKRLFDVICSFAGLAMLIPVFLLIAFLINREDEGPIFYRGIRIGLHGKPFRIFKFRTMLVDADRIGPSSTSEGDPRITNVGSFLRRHKLDELPQLFNVLAGDMSFVGPRPQVRWAVDLYTDSEKDILSIRPGITDYASLLFSNEGEILKGSIDPDRDYLDKIHPVKTYLALKYVHTRSFWIDFKIILDTVATIFKR